MKIDRVDLRQLQRALRRTKWLRRSKRETKANDCGKERRLARDIIQQKGLLTTK